MSLSPSKLTSFKDCPKAFQYSYVDRLPEVSSPHLLLGTLVHSALEELYVQPVGARKASVRSSLAWAWCLIEDTPDFLECELGLPEQDAMYEAAGTLITNAIDLEDPDSVDVRSTELKLEAEVDGVTYRGIIDRVDNLPGGGIGVVDYKTGRVPTQDKERQKMEGVYFYALLCEQVLGQRPEWVRLDYLATPVSVTCVVNDQMIRGLKGRAAAVQAAIELGDFQPRVSPLCSWCAYRAICPSFGGKP